MSEKKEWFKSEQFWIEYGPIMFDTQRWAEAPDVAEAVKRICKLNDGGKIVDAGCGPGRIAIELALLNLDVTGVDLIEPFLEAAKETAADEGVNINLVQADLRTFETTQEFDAACNLYTSFGYCDTIEDDVKILKQIYKCLKKGGTFVLETLSRENASRDFIEGEWFERAGKTVLTEFTVHGHWEGLKSHWILIDNETGEKIDHCFIQRLYSAPELRDYLYDCGFSDVKVYGDFNFSPYNHKARTMVLVATK